MRRTTQAGTLVLLVGLLIAFGAPAAGAHPLGNATVNHYDGLHLYTDRVVDTAVEDVAEIPTYQRQGDIDRNGDRVLTAAERASYAAARCAQLGRTVTVAVGGRRLPMRVTNSAYGERPGAIGLKAGRLDCTLQGDVDLSHPARLSFQDDWDGQGIGWHEITAVASGLSLKASPFPARTISSELRRYPNNLLSSPLDLRSGTLDLQPGEGASTYALAKRLPVAGPAVRALNSLASTFNRTVGARHLTVGVGLLAVLLSLLLGAGHAFLPGHGKTIMAAYLVGRRGRLRDVVTVGATVTLTHTAGVLVLGLAITTTASFAPTAAEQALGVVSGLIVAGVGAGLLVSALRRHRRGTGTSLQDVPAAQHAVEEAVDGLHLGTVPSRRQQVAGDVAVLAPPQHRHPHPEHPHPGHPHPGHDHPPFEHPLLEHPHVEHPPADQDHHLHPHPLSEHPQPDHEHEHHPHTQPGHGHGLAVADSGPHRHGLGRSHRHGPSDGGFSKGGLVGLGIAGGLVPSPSALLVLLAATALGRTVFGVVLVLTYGLGMAGALSAAGLLLVKLRGRLDRFAGSPRLARADRLLAVLPVLTALLVLAVGAGLTLRAIGGSV